MRLVNLMSFVGAMLLLAMIPACLQFGRLTGAVPSFSWATLAAVGCLVVLAARRS